MARNFTVIRGGLSTAPADPAADAAARASAALEVDLRAAAGIDAETVAAWRALMTRTGTDDPFQDPDYLLTAAQHQAAGQTVAFALVWTRPAAATPMLHGVLPLRIRRPLLVRDRAEFWQPPGLSGTPTVESARAGAVTEAVRAHLLGLARPVRLVDPADPASGAGAQPPLRTLAAPRRTIPPSSLFGVRPDGYEAASVEHVRDPARVRDAVETFLALDARTARRPIIADPADAAMVRVVSRLFARRRQIGVELTRRGGTVVAGTLRLGAGPRTVAWRHAAGD